MILPLLSFWISSWIDHNMANFAETNQWLTSQGLGRLSMTLLEHDIMTMNDLRANLFSPEPCLAKTDQILLKQALRIQEEPTQASYDGRQDAPCNNPRTRGNLQKALEAALPENRARSLADLEKDMYANTSRQSRDSLWSTWCVIADKWDVDPVPITSDTAKKIGASFNKGGYRSARMYYNRAKEEHVKMTHQCVPPDIEKTIAQCLNSIERGIGPTQVKDGFPVEALRSAVNIHPNKLLLDTRFMETMEARVDMVILGCWWMTREIELATTKAHHLWPEHRTNSVFWTLPVQKNDASGGCISRPHRCCCKGQREPMCPFHAAERHMMRLEHAFPTTQWEKEELPLFPDHEGRHFAKEKMIEMIRSVITLTGVVMSRPGPTNKPMPRFGGHVLRVTGAQMLARAGIELFLIQLIGRWGSEAILRYVQLAHLYGSMNIAARTVTGIQDLTPESDEQPPTDPHDQPKKRTKKAHHATPIEYLPTKDLMAIIEETVNKKLSAAKRFVGNPETHFVHLPAINDDCVQSLFLHARCGWPYGRGRNFQYLSKIDYPWKECAKCLKASAFVQNIDNLGDEET